MSSFDYAGMQALAGSILKDFKQGAASLIQFTPAIGGSAFNPGAATENPPISLNAVAKGVSTKYVMQQLAVASDIEVTAAVVPGVTPTQNDKIDVDGVRYKIVQFIKIPNAGVAVVWKFIARK